MAITSSRAKPRRRDPSARVAPLEQAACDVARQKMAEMSGAVLGLHQRAIVHNHCERTFKLKRDGPGKVEPAAGDEGDFDAARGGFDDSFAVGLGQLVAAVEERPVYINGDEFNGHGNSLPHYGT